MVALKKAKTNRSDGKGNLRKEWKKNKGLFIMVAPSIVFFLIFSYVPMVGLYYAFTRYNFNDGFFSPFVGLDNFKFLFRSGTLWTITRNTLAYNIVFMVFGNLFQLVTAIVISELIGKKVKKFMQSAIFLPYFISFVLLGAFAYNLFNYETGLFNSIRESLGMAPIDIYGSPVYWYFILPIFYIWKNVGYGSVIYLSAITNIDQEIYEAADIDGANIFQKIRYITLPMLKGTVIILVLFSLGKIMKGQFDMFYNLVGNNGLLFNATDIIDTYVYRTLMINFDVGMGTAAGLYQSIFGFCIIMVANHLIKKADPDYALF